MDTVVVPVKLIDLPEMDRKKRTFSKEFASQLAEDIRVQGLLNPITLRPNPAKPGRYLLVAGRHRLHATATVLKEESIDARVYDDFDDTDAMMATIAENLWRNPLTKPQHLLAIQAWHAIYTEKYPESVGKGKGGAKRAARKAPGAVVLGGGDGPVAAKAAGDESPIPTVGIEAVGDDVAAGPDPEPAAKEVAGFVSVLADSTGQSQSSAYRDLRLARIFSADQLEVFAQMGVGATYMDTIAALDDAAQRSMVVNLIASGMDTAEAIAHVARPEGGVVTLTTGRTVQASEPVAAGAQKLESDMTDEEWLASACGQIRERLKFRAAFDNDAILYRKTRDCRQALKGKAKKLIGTKVGVRGGFHRLFSRLLNIAHPRDWLMCGTCDGRGNNPQGKCPACYGDGFTIKTEDAR